VSDYFARIAFLKYLQNENGCKRTGKPCRERHLCGCAVELEDYIQAELLDAVKGAGK
jgi:hypothetical protein